MALSYFAFYSTSSNEQRVQKKHVDPKKMQSKKFLKEFRGL